MAIRIAPLALLSLAQAFTRYKPSKDVLFENNLANATSADVTAFSSYPIQSGFYWWMTATHGYGSLPIFLILITQWVRMKGDSIHVNLGLIVKWTFVAFLLQGWVLYFRHSFLSDPKAFNEYPLIFDPPLARCLVSFFGFSVCACAGHAFWIGIRDESRRVGLNTPAFYFIKALSWMTFVCGTWFYVFAIHRLLTEPVASFKWEITLEMMVILSVLLPYDGTCLWAMAGWAKTGELRAWKEHHHMAAAWVSSQALAAFMLFFTHDARHIWTWPGIQSVWLRLAMQLAPQCVLFACTVPRIVAYVMVCGPNQEKSTMLNEMAEQS